MLDKMTVTGLGPSLDGTYDFDLTELFTVGAATSLNNREGHRLKMMTGVRMGEIQEALTAGDNDVAVGLAAILLSRHGKRFDEAVLWDAPMGAAIHFELAEDEGDVEVPPAEATVMTLPSRSSGDSSATTSESPGSDPNPTGNPDSAMPTSAQDSAPRTSAI